MKSLRLLGLAWLLLLLTRLSAQSYTFSNLASSYFSGGIVVDAAGNLYGTNYYGHSVFKVTPAGAISTIAGQPGISGSIDGTGPNARFWYPRGIALDAAGNLYVADSSNDTIRKITTGGVVSTLAGQPGVRGLNDGTTDARFDTPLGVAVDAAGNVYVADSGTHAIRKISASGVVSTLAGGYPAIAAGSVDGTGTAARFFTPTGIAVDSAGNVYVADRNNHAIRKITPAGVVTTLAGLLGSMGFADGVGPTARFNAPEAVAVDSAGNVFVADGGNYTIRKISPAGVATTIAGLAIFAGDVSGTGSTARFNTLRGIAVDSNATVYVADSYQVKLGAPSSQLAITVQPQSQSVAAGSAAIFSVTATGTTPLSYQWQKNGVALTGATNSSLTLSPVSAGDTGAYTVAITNPVSTVTSSGATLTVLASLTNDNFSSAQVITGTAGTVTGKNNGATGEPLEPTHVVPNATASSAWYAWTPSQSGTAVFDTSAGFSVGVAAYTGATLGTLTRVATNLNSNRLVFTATAGTTYSIAVGSIGSADRGNFTLTWRTILNDNFASAQDLTGNTGSIVGNNSGATGEAGEPIHFNSAGTATSIWYKWTPTLNGVAIIDTAGTQFDTVLAVYTGTALNALTRITQDYNSNPVTSAGRSRATFVANANTTYYIAVGSANYVTGNITLNWQLVAGPVATSFPVSATLSQGTNYTLSVNVLSFLAVTYQWLRNDVALPSANGSTLTLTNAQAGDTAKYSVVVSNGVNTINVSATITVLIPPANDNFPSAQAISGLTGTVTGSNVNATGETGEPAHWNSSGALTSVWYKWTPASSGLAVIDTVGSNFDTVLAVYTGTSLSSLTRLVQDDDSGGGHTSHVSFSATGGTTYYIAVGGSNTSARGTISLNWQLSSVLAISTQPITQTIAVGGSATFSVAATGTGLTYQWFRNGTPIPGATASTLTVANVQGGADASYTVTVTNSSGSVTSAPVTLAVALPALTHLTLRNTRPGGSLLWSITGGAGMLVTVGDGGAILTSSDNGLTWTPRNSGTTLWLVGVTYGNGQFVIVGDRGLILTSTDGVTWTQAAASGTTQRLNNVIFADGKFVAVGEGGAIVTSTDARIWTPRNSGIITWLHGLAYNASVGMFAASGQSGVFLYSSDDGATWNKLPIANLTDDLEAVVAVDSYAQFIAIGGNGVEATVKLNQLTLKTGETLLTWTGDAGTTASGVRLRGLAQGASALFATGENGKVITATDDRGPWYTLPSNTSANLLAGLYFNNTLFIVGEDETILQSDSLFSSRLINISTRGQVGTGANMMISGFVIQGTRPKQVLIRAVGATLESTFGLTGTLIQPVLTIFDSNGNTLASNTGWNVSTATAPFVQLIANAAARVGAFPLFSSQDSALLLTLNPGQYTAQVAGVNNTTGLSLVEVYDADALSNDTSRAINISTRGIVGTGANKLIAGFVVNGASSRKVLIRAVGPGLTTNFGVPGTVAEPQLELYNSKGLLTASAGAWGLQSNADEIRGTSGPGGTSGAFALTEGSKDSAMVITLLPGAWTVQVSGANNTTGVVIVEVYALP